MARLPYHDAETLDPAERDLLARPIERSPMARRKRLMRLRKPCWPPRGTSCGRAT
jgi:hypothetical protein